MDARDFFELFLEHAEQIVHASRELASLMEAFDDVQRRCYNIETIEKRGDRIAHTAIELLHKTFITPLDRDDIHQLITSMDDILDMMEDAAQSIYLYDIRSVTLASLGDVIGFVSVKTHTAFAAEI